eukprot:jgi/Mesvir1/22698/Mv14114-RA.1
MSLAAPFLTKPGRVYELCPASVHRSTWPPIETAAASKAGYRPRHFRVTATTDAKDGTAPKPHAKLHDFCLTFPYGAVMALVGMVALVTKAACGPAFSASCLVSGLLLLASGGKSLSTWTARNSCTPYTVFGQVVAAAYTFLVGKLVLKGAPIFPHGVIVFFSLPMALFYAYNMLAGGNPPPSAKYMASHSAASSAKGSMAS